MRHKGLFQCCRYNDEVRLTFSSVAIESLGGGGRLIAQEITKWILNSYIILINTQQNYSAINDSTEINLFYTLVCLGIRFDKDTNPSNASCLIFRMNGTSMK